MYMCVCVCDIGKHTEQIIIFKYPTLNHYIKNLDAIIYLICYRCYQDVT